MTRIDRSNLTAGQTTDDEVAAGEKLEEAVRSSRSFADIAKTIAVRSSAHKVRPPEMQFEDGPPIGARYAQQAIVQLEHFRETSSDSLLDQLQVFLHRQGPQLLQTANPEVAAGLEEVQRFSDRLTYFETLRRSLDT